MRRPSRRRSKVSVPALTLSSGPTSYDSPRHNTTIDTVAGLLSTDSDAGVCVYVFVFFVVPALVL